MIAGGRRTVGALGIAAAVTLVAGCAAPAPDPLPSGVTVSLVQYRSDYGPRRLQLVVANQSAAALTVTSASLDAPGYASPASHAGASHIDAGATVALPVTLPPAVCADAGAVGASTVTVTADGPDGTAYRGALSPDDPEGWLECIHRQDCLDQAVAEQVSLTAGPVQIDRSGDRPVARLTLTVTATASVRGIGIDAVSRTILFRPAEERDSWPLGWHLDEPGQTASEQLSLVPSNCNPHILAEDKRGTYWPMHVTLADGLSGVSYLASNGEVHGELYAFFAEYCGF